MWWKTFADPYEPYLLFRRNSLGGLWTVGYLLALCALVATFGTDMLPQLAIPVALGGLYVFLSYVTGVVGMAVLAPIIMYAWLCLDWMVLHGLGATNQVAALEGLVWAMLIVVFLIAAPHVRAKLLVLVICEGAFYGILSSCTYYLLAFGAQKGEDADRAGQLMDKLVVGFLWGAIAVAAIVLVIVIAAVVRSKAEKREIVRQLGGNLLMFVVGLVPPVVGSLLARVNPVLGMASVLALYAGVAYLARQRGLERVCWALVPLVLLGTFAVIAQAPLDLLPVWKPGATLMQSAHDGFIGKMATTLATPLLEGTSQTLGPLLCRALQGGMDLLKKVDGSTAALPEKFLILQLLGLYALAFLASVVMGTIVGIADIREYATGRKELAGAGQGADDALSQSGEVEEASATSASAEDATVQEPQLLPSWITGGSLRNKLMRRGEEEPAETSTDAYVQVERVDGTIGRRIVSRKRILSRELRLALGLPVVEKLGKRRRHNWDEQLSGAVPCFEDAHLSQTAIHYLDDRVKRPIRKGLWWKVFEDDGRLELIPKGSGMDLLFVWLPLIAVLRIAPTDIHASLTTPIAIILSVMGVCHVLGLLGNIVTGPMLLYGWSVLMWILGQHNASQLSDPSMMVDPLTLFGLLIVATTFTRALRRDMGWTVSMAFYGAGAAWLCAQRYAFGLMDEQTVRTYMGYVYLASMVIAAVFTLRLLYKETVLLRRWPEALPDELKCVVLALAGVLPLAAASALSGAGPLLALLGATAVYVALTVVGRLRSPKGLSCLLLPLLVGTAAWSLKTVDAGLLPPSTMTDRLVGMCAGGPLELLAGGAMSVMEGCTRLLEGPVRTAILFVLNLASDQPIPSEQALASELVQVCCLFAGILIIASLMGVAVSLLEGARPDLVSAVHEREQHVMDMLNKKDSNEEASVGETAVEETAADVDEGVAEELQPEDEGAEVPLPEPSDRDDVEDERLDADDNDGTDTSSE